MAPFDIKELREMMSDDALSLDMLGTKPMALFVQTSDNDHTFDFISAMIYAQMFNLLIEKADREYGGRLPRHVMCLLDEFCNIRIPNFERLIATIRSREISTMIVVQNMSQLKGIYKDHAATIVGNCDTRLFLGGRDPETLKEITEALGRETIDLRNESDTRGREHSYGQNFQRTGRELLTKDELAIMENDECILMVRGLRPFRSKKYDITHHPRYIFHGEVRPQNIYKPLDPHKQVELKLLQNDEYVFFDGDEPQLD
jgi:type IV secretion system protein VirD4